MYLYHERESTNNNNRTKLCLWSTKQRLTIEQIAVGTNAILFTTNTGQVYSASLDKLSSTNNKKVEHGKNTKRNVSLILALFFSRIIKFDL